MLNSTILTSLFPVVASKLLPGKKGAYDHVYNQSHKSAYCHAMLSLLESITGTLGILLPQAQFVRRSVSQGNQPHLLGTWPGNSVATRYQASYTASILVGPAREHRVGPSH